MTIPTNKPPILINADIGEMTGNDAAILPHIQLGNIACGKHASDPTHMAQTVKLCIEHGVKIAAHPSYDDRENFGRVSQPMSTTEAIALVAEQVEDLQRICHEQAVELSAIKPHGALYHDMMQQPHIREAMVTVATKFSLPLVVLTSDDSWDTPVLREAFADRGYTADGSLLARSEPGSLIAEPEAIVQQAQQMLREQCVQTADGTCISVNPDTLCFHGDHPASVTALQLLAH